MHDVKKNDSQSKIKSLPIMLFAGTMGLGGLCVAYKKLSEIFDLSGEIFSALRALDCTVFCLLSAFYFFKLLKFKEEVKAEFSHPIKINFFGGFIISLFLLALAYKDAALLYYSLFYAALGLQTIFTLYVISFWIDEKFDIATLNPAWFIPVVGNLLIPIIAEKSQAIWYYFSLGLFFWIILFAVIFYRLVFCDKLADKFIPTLVITLAPPAMAFLGYIKLTEQFDAFAAILLNINVFFVALILFSYKRFIKLKFALSWWAFTFPTAASSIAFLKAYEIAQSDFYLVLGVGAFAALVASILIVGFLTVKSIINGEIFSEK
ncbi:SLAC1 anion channel family protein [Campylobacter concisus]|uniref:SLAC1 anion channel family protein n=1 Tax=Campylobacter concisus TaxID=199 RepID=UPI00122C9C04|nr:SLAC1 anion channel family protein [Campylobacter concisus]